jgi:PKD repeat protein/uncharacterized spore protein YtfJ
MFIPLLIKAEWIPLIKSNSNQLAPNVTIVSEDDNGIILKYEISGFDLKEIVTGGKTYQLVDLLSESFTTESGLPELPYIARTLAIPDQAGISIEVLETGDKQIFNNIYLPPARESWIEGSPESPYNENTEVYNSMKTYPGAYAQMGQPSVFRDFRIARISVFPIKYLPAKKELQVVSSITIKINYTSGNILNPKTTAKKSIPPSYGKLYRSFIFNYQQVLDKYYGGKEEGHELMLCLMPDEFEDNFQAYAEWKRRSGTDIHVTKFSDIGANSSDPSIIKNHIVDAYTNWEVPPSYVLLVGDDGLVPVYADYNANENYYGTIEGNDYFPEVMVGRFTHQSDYQMQVMINKFLLYEQTPYTSNTDWFKKGICCSNDAYASQVETKRFAASRMLDFGGFTSVDTMMSDYPCNYNLNDVVAALNEGRSFLNYRGEGWSSGWWASCTPMNVSDVASLNNGQKFTFVTSIGCGVAMFAGGSNCFGEEWVESGTLSNPKGAVAFIGPTGNTHTTYNNKIDKGIYVGMFEEGMDTPGQAMLRGKLYMYNVFGNEPYVESHYKLYCILGDPSIHIWKDIPEPITVEYPATIPLGNNTIEFTVTHTSTSQPVADAQVCITGNTLFSTAYTDEFGKAYVETEAEVLETFNVTVRGGNVIPFKGTLLVAPPTGPYVIHDSYIINDVAGGNANGLMDYGETNLLSLTMINVGVEQAEDVVVTIQSNNPYINITDNTANYGSIAPGATLEIADGFAYTVANDIPDLEEVSIAIMATNGSASWESFIVIEAHAPILEYMDYEISDPAGNNNGKLDPGETANIIITLENSGSSEVMNVIGELIESDPFITLNTSQMSFGSIAGGSQGNAIYSVSVEETTPAGHLAQFSLMLNGDLGINAVGVFGIVIGQVPVLIVDLDENNNSASEMEVALDVMDVTYDIFTSFPPDLNLYSTVFVCLGIFSDNHVLTSSEGQNLVDYLNNGGSLYMEGGDTWAYDQGTAVHSMFNINGTNDGSSNMGNVVGNTDTFTEGMSFYYSGDNSFMDHIEPIGSAIMIFDNDSPPYGTAVAYDNGNYKTIGSSHEFGGLQDGASPSTKEELMAKYLDFFNITISLQALFISNTTEICENSTIDFYDQSTGNVISWEWIFEGGNPATSSEQNPSVSYATDGNYDVTLTVSDGVENKTITLEDYITVESIPQQAPLPIGSIFVCANDESTYYSTIGVTEVDDYVWTLEPEDAGYIVNNNLSAMVFWDSEFLGEVNLSVAGVNSCGTGEFSDQLTISRYFPDVSLEPFDWVCLDWPAFELAGGFPLGGEYSGAGVEDGWFNPSLAGPGTHTITYTYADALLCENYAAETILVDPCTEINENNNNTDVLIYPNPGKGTFTLRLNHVVGKIELTIFNSMNEHVFMERNLSVTKYSNHNLNLNHLPAGIYYLHISGDDIEEVRKIVIEN